ncbi:hypothetical protein F7C95_15210 [Opitutia bacterium ISCC 51]|nr:hypothetical protein F7C95_15210 [Opitutae bacterium ISCC 51]QXD27335.1 hypothetical protein GA003_15115 [Opitutae bacterium ISCC 52]
MVQLNLEAAQGASAGLYPDTARQAERGEHPEGVHPLGIDGILAGAAFAVFAWAQPNTAAFPLRPLGFEGHVLMPKNPFCHYIISILKWY